MYDGHIRKPRIYESGYLLDYSSLNMHSYKVIAIDLHKTTGFIYLSKDNPNNRFYWKYCLE